MLGLLIILALPINAIARAAAAISWCFLAAVDVASLAAMHKRFSRLRIYPDGTAELRQSDGDWQAAVITHGSLVLPGIAWLRLRLRDGGYYRGLVRGSSCESKQWRRLQVIWRHLGTAT